MLRISARNCFQCSARKTNPGFTGLRCMYFTRPPRPLLPIHSRTRAIPGYQRRSPHAFHSVHDHRLDVAMNDALLVRSCAKLCHASGGELDQIRFLLGQVSVQTTERYLGCKQRIRGARERPHRHRTVGAAPVHRGGSPNKGQLGFVNTTPLIRTNRGNAANFCVAGHPGATNSVRILTDCLLADRLIA